MISEKNALPPVTIKYLAKLVEEFKSALSENLAGIYVHGSIAMGCFNPNSSDLDVLVIVKSILKNDLRQKIIEIYNRLSTLSTNKVELNVINKDMLMPFQYPTPCELYLTGEEDSVLVTAPNPGIAAGIAAGIVITKKYGISLYREPIDSIFPDVPKKYYLDSISKDAEWSYNNIMKGPDEGLCLVPVYAVLNFCRVLAYIKSDLILSKKEGAKWALENFPKHYISVIQEALNEYIEENSSKEVDCRILKELALYANEEIKTVLAALE